MSIPFYATLLYVSKRTRGSRPEDIGRRIRERREDRGLKQEDLAQRAGITQGTLSSLEKGRTKEPEASTILALSAALQTSPYVLMYDHVPPEAMEHTVAALIDVWDRLDERQRLQVVAYAQGLIDSAGKQVTPGPRKQQPPVSRKPSSGSH